MLSVVIVALPSAHHRRTQNSTMQGFTWWGLGQGKGVCGTEVPQWDLRQSRCRGPGAKSSRSWSKM